VTYVNCTGAESQATVVPRDTFCATFGKIISYSGGGFPQSTTQSC
jgi:hypothetical protein